MQKELKNILVNTRATSPLIGGSLSEEVVALRSMSPRFSVTKESGLPSAEDVKCYDLVVVNIDRVSSSFRNRTTFGQDVLDVALQTGLLIDVPFLATTHMLAIAPSYEAELKKLGVRDCIALGVSILGQPMPMHPMTRKKFESHVAEALGLIHAAQEKRQTTPQPK